MSELCIKLTNAIGQAVWVQRSWVQMVCPPLLIDTMGDAEGVVNTVLILSGHRVAVREPIDEVMKLLGESFQPPPPPPEPSKPFRMG